MNGIYLVTMVLCSLLPLVSLGLTTTSKHIVHSATIYFSIYNYTTPYLTTGFILSVLVERCIRWSGHWFGTFFFFVSPLIDCLWDPFSLIVCFSYIFLTRGILCCCIFYHTCYFFYFPTVLFFLQFLLPVLLPVLLQIQFFIIHSIIDAYSNYYCVWCTYNIIVVFIFFVIN